MPPSGLEQQRDPVRRGARAPEHLAPTEASGVAAVDGHIEIPIQVKGKVRSRIQVAADADEATIREAALADEKIAALLDGEPRKVIVVPGRMVNVVP